MLVAVGGIGREAVLRLLDPQLVVSNTMHWVAAVGLAINAGAACLLHAGRREASTSAACRTTSACNRCNAIHPS
ncbi:hypothetical protein [Dankookia sp. P2]|uniref:hypothetical protein n=1 Tax=Dankookia sp. P2 TaxID=3423955 RepID=UPI003D671F96